MNPSGESIAVGVVLIATIAAYALFAGADFGGGIWDLLAGDTARGAEPRAAIDSSVTPVWEANHVWIVLGLVVVWTGFPAAFAAVMTSLFVPLALSLLGIVLRGLGFAFRHEAERFRVAQFWGALFAASSLMTPFFLGTVIGAVATGQVPADPHGNLPGAWTTPTALMTGFLFVSACAYIGAVYLVSDSSRRGEPEMAEYFARRALGAGLVTGALAAANMLLLATSARYVFDRLIGPALPLVVLSVLSGITALVLVALGHRRLPRIAGAVAVASVVGAWGWAQYPWLLPGSLSMRAGSAPTAALLAVMAVAGLAIVLVLPSFCYLYWLQQHGRLESTETSDSLRRAAAAANRPVPLPAPPPTRHPLLTAAVIAAAAADMARDLLGRKTRQ